MLQLCFIHSQRNHPGQWRRVGELIQDRLQLEADGDLKAKSETSTLDRLKKNPVQHNNAWKTFVASVFILLLNDGDIVYMQWRLITTLKANARHCMFEWSAVSFPGLFKAVLVFHRNDWFIIWVTVVSTEALSVLKPVLILVKESGCFCAVFYHHQVCWLNKCMYCVSS